MVFKTLCRPEPKSLIARFLPTTTGNMFRDFLQTPQIGKFFFRPILRALGDEKDASIVLRKDIAFSDFCDSVHRREFRGGSRYKAVSAAKI